MLTFQLLRWLTAIVALLLLSGIITPSATHAANTCGVFIQIEYPAVPPEPLPVPGDIVRVRLTFGTGSISGGTQVTINRVRFDMDCNSTSPLGIPCTDDGAIIEYQGDGTITTSCIGIVFSTGHPIDANPNQLVFGPSPALVVPASSPEFCDLEFDVKVLAQSADPTPFGIEEVAGFSAAQLDAQCDNGLSSSGSQSAVIALCSDCGLTTTTTSTTTSTTLHGCAPGNKGALRCETGIATAVAQLVKDVIKCSLKDARALVGSNPPVELSADGDACEMEARANFDETLAKIAEKGGCPPSVVANAPTLADDAVAQTRQNLDSIFICPAP